MSGSIWSIARFALRAGYFQILAVGLGGGVARRNSAGPASGSGENRLQRGDDLLISAAICQIGKRLVQILCLSPGPE